MTNLQKKTALSRRAVATGLAALGLSVQDVLSATKGGLGALAATKGIRFGTAVGVRSVADKTGTLFDVGWQKLMREECRILVPENELKAYVIERKQNERNFAPADAIFKFAAKNKIAMRGHTLCWARDKYTPNWLLNYGFSSRLEAENMFVDYITSVMTHCGDKIGSWDVVNEIVSPETGDIRPSVYTRQMGKDALKIAYQTARQLKPKGQLVYNDYMCWEEGSQTHQQGVLNLLRWFRKENVPVDALGIQSHLGTGYALTSGQVKTWKAFVDEVVGMGFDILITELDVNDQKTEGTIEQRDQISAKVLREYMDLMLSYTSLKDVLMWGLVNRDNWLQGFTPRPDKLPLRPTLFDDQYRPTALYAALKDSFKAAPKR